MDHVDIDAVEKQYSPSEWSHRFSPFETLTNYLRVTSKGSEAARKDIDCEEGILYGEKKEEKLDIYGRSTLPSDSPVFVYIHGGFWLEGSRKYSSFMVPPLYRNGIISIIIGYTLIPKVTLDEIVAEIHRAINYVIRLAKESSSKGIYLCGHSAGAHLAAMVMSSAWPNKADLAYIKGVILLSGLMNLKPLLPTSMKQQLSLTEKLVEENSPLMQVHVMSENLKKTDAGDNVKCHILVLVADHDSPAFQEQSKVYYQALVDHSIDAELLLAEDEDHFSIVEKLEDESFHLTQKIIKLIKNEHQD